MIVYKELDNLNLEELINCWHEPSPDGEEYAASYDSEVAFLIRDQGEAGIAFLVGEISKADTERLGSILSTLPPLEHPVLADILVRYLHDERPHIVASAIIGLQYLGGGRAHSIHTSFVSKTLTRILGRQRKRQYKIWKSE